VKALPPLLHHLRDDFGWILEVGVDQHYGLATGIFQPRADGDLMAEIARQPDQLRMGA
jgi:hypothetical protein